jgi:hypothetical protein
MEHACGKYYIYYILYNIKMDYEEMWYNDVNWINLAYYRVQWRTLVNTVT